MNDARQSPRGGHWSLDAESAEFLMERLGGIKERVSEIYEGPTSSALEEINQRLTQLQSSLSKESGDTKRQVRDLIEYTGRLKSLMANRFLEIETEIKRIQDKFEDVRKKAELDAQYKAQLITLERWKLVVTVVVAFLTGLLFPVVIYLLGVSSP
jgi:vacuolar-type H+-ATPase subunit E/Vma4